MAFVALAGVHRMVSHNDGNNNNKTYIYIIWIYKYIV